MMDPLTALGVAGNVIQFVDFGLKLVGKTVEIAGSAKGATAHNLELETVYMRLQAFSSELELAETWRPFPQKAGTSHHETLDELDIAHNRAMRPHLAAIQCIAADCNVLCRQLLDAVQSLHVKASSVTSSDRYVKSFLAALKSAFRAKNIEDLDERLRRFQALLGLHFFPLLMEQHSHMSRRQKTLESLNRSLAREQSAAFKGLSTQLDTILEKINALSSKADTVPDNLKLSTGSVASKTDEQPLHSGDIERLGEILEGLSVAEKDFTIAANTQALLTSLHFSSRTYRHEDIPEAHKATFEWIFSTDKQEDLSTTPHDKLNAMPGALHALNADLKVASTTTAEPGLFMTWLESGSGTFWISGRPGTGKSTLMKFIASHTKTRRALEVWAGQKKPVIASHYFWSAGDKLQNSLKGLLLELVFDILCCSPELAELMFPDCFQGGRWVSPSTVSGLPGPDEYWTIRTLRKGLKRLAKSGHTKSVKCCFFIDGLDEHEGDHSKLCRLLKKLVASGNIKCCVSSRPWNVFDIAFAEQAFLRIHDLTDNDINIFARNRLQHIFEQKEATINEAQAQELALFITKQARGVFLWVFLVTKSLREGVIDGDTFDDLQQRLKAMPDELEPYFKLILDSVNPINHNYMARILKIAIHAKWPLHCIVYYACEHEPKNPNYALTMPVEFDLLNFSRHTAYLPFKRRINARSGGLLAIQANGRIDFIHRTARDFLLTSAMRTFLASKLPPGFKVNLTTLKAMAFQFRTMLTTLATSTDKKDRSLREFFPDIFTIADNAIEEDQQAATLLLDSIVNIHQNPEYADAYYLYDAFQHIFQTTAFFREQAHRIPAQRSRSETMAAWAAMVAGDPASPNIGFMALREGANNYVLASLRKNPGFFGQGHGASAIITTLLSKTPWPQARADVVAALLENNIYSKTELEEAFFHFLMKIVDHGVHSQTLISMEIGRPLLVAFLKHGGHSVRFSDLCALKIFVGDAVHRLSELRITTILEIVDMFLDVSPDDNKLQVPLVLSFMNSDKVFHCGNTDCQRKCNILQILDKLLLKAMELDLSVDCLEPVAFNPRFRSGISPDVLEALQSYIIVARPKRTLSLCESDDKNGDDDERKAKRPQVESSAH